MGEIFLSQMLSLEACLPHRPHSGQGQDQTYNNGHLGFPAERGGGGVGEEGSHGSCPGLPVGIHETALLRHKSHTL